MWGSGSQGRALASPLQSSGPSFPSPVLSLGVEWGPALLFSAPLLPEMQLPGRAVKGLCAPGWPPGLLQGQRGEPRLERVALWADGSLTDPGPRWPREQPAPCRPPVCRRLLLRAGMEQHQQVYPSFPCGLSADLPWLHPSPAWTLLSQKVPGLAGAQQEALGTCGLHVGICFLGISESHWAQLWNLSLR